MAPRYVVMEKIRMVRQACQLLVVKAYVHSCSLGPLLQRLVGKLGQCPSPLTG